MRYLEGRQLLSLMHWIFILLLQVFALSLLMKGLDAGTLDGKEGKNERNTTVCILVLGDE